MVRMEKGGYSFHSQFIKIINIRKIIFFPSNSLGKIKFNWLERILKFDIGTTFLHRYSQIKHR